MKLGRRQEPEKIERNGSDLKIIKSKQHIARAWKLGCDNPIQDTRSRRHSMKASACEKVDAPTDARGRKCLFRGKPFPQPGKSFAVEIRRKTPQAPIHFSTRVRRIP
jgi:hypothetical protein